MVIIEEGSVNRAAGRLRITQPALSRQMKSLEDELGGKLLERETSGVKPTGLCHEVLAAMPPILASYDKAIADLKTKARGEKAELRVGYLISAAQPLLTPALASFRTTHPDMKLKLHDMSPREQVDALRAGEIDVALVGQEGGVAARDFYSRKLGSMGVCAALSASDPLAARSRIKLEALREREFIGVDETEVPGRNQWMTSLCRKAGFRPRFAATCDGIHNILSLVVSESATTLMPAYIRCFNHPGVAFVPVSDAKDGWDFIVLWQRGRVSKEVRAFIDALSATAEKVWPPAPASRK
jgi:DNA-binding transcriptional LysR family regulator